MRGVSEPIPATEPIDDLRAMYEAEKKAHEETAKNLKESKLQEEMSWGCLMEIREFMESISGEKADEKGIPPMFYGEWMLETYGKLRAKYDRLREYAGWLLKDLRGPGPVVSLTWTSIQLLEKELEEGGR